MEQKMVRSIQRQLRGLADSIAAAGDEQTAVLMAQVGASLMANCAKLAGASLGGMSEDSFADVMDACALTARNTAGVMDHPRCAALAKQAEMLSQLRQAGETAAANGANLQQETDRLRRENAEAEQKNDQLNAELRTLLQTGIRLAEELDSVRSEYREASERMHRMSEKKAELERQWNALDPELQQCARATRDLEQTLERLNARREDFGPERQSELRAEIEAVEAQTQSDRSAADALNKTLDQLRRSAVQISDERSALESGVLDAVKGALSRLEIASDSALSELESVRHTVDTLDSRIARCRSLYQDYASWLDANGAVMDELARILGENDPLHSSLRETLDPAQTEQLRRLRESAQDSLRQMDALLAPCIRLMSSNRRVVLGKVSQGPGAGGGVR